MADTEGNDEISATDPAPAEPSFSPQRLYLKDLSFEAPKGTNIFLKQWEPKVDQQLSTTSFKLDDDLFEVALRITITVKDKEEVLYLVEVEQGGIFKIIGLDEPKRLKVLNVMCPNILFPFVREVVDNVVTKASFPPLMLPPVNFDALFIAALEKAKAQKPAEQSGKGKTIAH